MPKNLPLNTPSDSVALYLMDDALIRRVALAYQLKPQTILAPQKGYRNQSWPIVLQDGSTVNFILYKNEPHIVERIRRANTVADYAARSKLPTRRTLSSQRIIELRTNATIRYGALYTYLPGHTIPWEAYRQQHVKLLGMAMGYLHSTLQAFSVPLPHVADEYLHILTRMQQYFSDIPVQQAMATKLGVQQNCNYELLAKTLAYSKQLSGQQALHMDFVRGNILFSTAQEVSGIALGNLTLSGILDFEKTAYGHPQFDLARTLAFLLVDCKYKSERDVRKYFLHSGYIKRGGQRLQTIPVKTAQTTYTLLEILIDLFLLYDFYKFLRHNPYEYLQQNEHFVRTKTILCSRGLIRDIR